MINRCPITHQFWIRLRRGCHSCDHPIPQFRIVEPGVAPSFLVIAAIDQFDSKWDLSGSVQECRFVMRLTEAVANEAAMPQFKKGYAIAGPMALAR